MTVDYWSKSSLTGSFRRKRERERGIDEKEVHKYIAHTQKKNREKTRMSNEEKRESERKRKSQMQTNLIVHPHHLRNQ